MELNVQLVKAYRDIHTIIPIAGNATHNIFKLSPGLCHGTRIAITVNDIELSPEKYVKLYPSSEFKVRYDLDSCSAVMLLDNTIRGKIVIKCYPIGGAWGDLNLVKLPTTGAMGDHYGRYLEEIGNVVGLTSYNRRFEEIPSHATDMDGILIGRTSYPGAGDVNGVSELERRVSALEGTITHNETNMPLGRIWDNAIHNTVNVPTLPIWDKVFTILDRSKPLVQLTAPNVPHPTWYFEPEDSEIEMEINPLTGEIMWVDDVPDPGTYKVLIYVMGNGIRSNNSEVHLNVR